VCPSSTGEPCHSLGCARRCVTAAVVVTFGAMPPLLWEESSGKTYPMCAPCWDLTRDTAERLLPGIEILRTALIRATRAG